MTELKESLRMEKGQGEQSHTTLEETVNQFFEARKTDSREFKALLDFYGKPRLKEFYQKWVDGKKLEREKR